MPPEAMPAIVKEPGPEAIASGMGLAIESAASANDVYVSFIVIFKKVRSRLKKF